MYNNYTKMNFYLKCVVCYTIGHYCQISLFHPQEEDPAGPAVSSGVFSAQL